MTENKEMRILVAEDDYLVAQDVIRTLKGLGYSDIIEASNGKEAVTISCDQKPDLVLMDIQMPKMDGLQAATEINKRCATAIIILTAYETKDFVDKASEAGVAAYLTKPPRADELDRAISIAIARQSDLQDLRRLNRELTEALAEIKTLRGILPICSHCKQIRDDEGYWHQIEAYIHSHTEANFSHGICPDCIKVHYPEFADVLDKE